jgi:ATP synthase I chain
MYRHKIEITSSDMSGPVAIAGSRTEARISWLTSIFGVTATIIAAFNGNRAWASGLAVGAILGWLNFRWLGRGLDALVAASKAQQGHEKPVVPWWNYLLALFRYALIGLTVYVIFIYRHIPFASMIVGLCALAAAAIVASVWEILAPEQGHLDR